MDSDNNQEISYISKKIIPISIFDPSTDIGINCARKAEALQYILENTEQENLLLLDVDCLIMKDVNELFKSDFDIAATGYGYSTNISSGFLAIKNNLRSKIFVKQWVNAQIQCHETERSRDQKTLSSLFKKYYKQENQKRVPSDGINIYDPSDFKDKKFMLLDHVDYNFHPDGNQKYQIEEWIKQIKLWKNKIHILHFAFKTIVDDSIINRAIESYKV